MKAPLFVCDIEMSLTPEELALLKQTADKLGKTVEEMARQCIIEHCHFELNTTKPIKKSARSKAKRPKKVKRGSIA